MPRDYKHRAQTRPVKRPLPAWLWLLTGILLGGFVVGLVWLDGQSTGPGAEWVGAIPDRVPQDTPEPVRRVETPAPPIPRFDFYNLLPEMEVIVPESEIKKPRVKPAAPDSPTTTAPASTTAGTFYLQVGSFRNAEQADNLKAKLAFSGFETVIHKATIEINGKSETFHRVRVGPFNNLEAANRSREKLITSGIDSKVVEIKG